VRAAVSSRYGPPEVVRIAEVPRPRIAGDQVLVRVAVTTVNRTDCGLRAVHPFVVRAFTGLRRPRVHGPPARSDRWRSSCSHTWACG